MLIQNLSKSKTLGENVIHSTQNIQFTSKCQKLMKYETLFLPNFLDDRIETWLIITLITNLALLKKSSKYYN